MTDIIKREQFRKKIMETERIIKSMDGALGEDPFPLRHSFTDGMYIREIFCPKGALIVTKIFKQSHATFLMSGECTIATDDGIQRIQAPFTIITRVGTKRVVFCHTDVWWITCHSNPDNTQDLEKIENRVIAQSFDDIPLDDNEQQIIDLAREGIKA